VNHLREKKKQFGTSIRSVSLLPSSVSVLLFCHLLSISLSPFSSLPSSVSGLLIGYLLSISLSPLSLPHALCPTPLLKWQRADPIGRLFIMSS
jgi:ABC-type uncharacterized transport system permease subunit